jgi:hypothetical protein
MIRNILKGSAMLLLGASVTATMAQRPPRLVVAKFFDDQYRQGGFDYSYGGTGSKVTVTKDGGYKSPSALQVNLDPNDYSGASICLYNESFDLSKYQLDAAVEFMIKGANGGEQLWFGLLDEEKSDEKKVQVKLPLNKYVQVSTDWQKVVIPLADFPERGLYWDQTKKTELPARIDLSKIAEFRVSIDKGTNKKFEVLIDNVEIVKGSVKKAAPKAQIVYWDEKTEVIDGPKNAEKLDGKATVLKTFYDNDLKGFSYVYGGLTAQKEQASKTAGNPNVLAMYLDDSEYSGITYSMGADKFADLSSVRNKGGVYFWIKGSKGGEVVSFGLMDNQGNDIKTQSKTNLKDWVQITKEWQLVKIPLKRFSDKGKAWDANKQAEVTKDMKWNKIQEIRFSVGKGENRREGNDPVTIYVDQITFTNNTDWVDPDQKWDSFKSSAPDLVLHDFESKPVWEPSFGPKSKLKLKVGKSANLDGNALLVEEYLMNDWVDNVFDFEKQKSDAKLRDWSKHWAIMFDIYTDKPWQGITLQIGDAGRELYVANTGAPRGRHTLMVPLRAFSKFPYYQPPEAVQNGQFDLNKICVLDFKPSGEGTSGSFQIDNVKLTNLRELPKQKVVESKEITIAGDFKKVLNPAVADAVFGINAALWDGDLLKPETEKLVKKVNHGIVRYPGGLRADDDHWEKILENKDWMVDTDEFLDWCAKTGTAPMFTVNFGSGTAEEAARWVEYTNIKKKANVKYWEIGNEIYGNWNNYYDKYGKDGGDIYGKRAREFVVAMKKVDPTIKVAVVGVLEGEWNEKVLKHTADVADGLIVHHYPQHFGEENDFAILSAPQTLEGIFARLHESMKKITKKPLEIWLTEWNSVDFNPGNQTLSLVNGLFVADYLGMLAKLGAGSAQYWDIHNDMTPEGGDYGYLSRSFDEVIGGNQPRPSYFAFQMASDGLRGKIVESKSGDDDLATYLAVNGNKKSLLVINKNPSTTFKSTLKIPGFVGKAKVEVLAAPKGKTAAETIKMKGPESKSMDIKEGAALEFPKHSITLITIE